MGKCCSIDRNELPDENIQIIKMKIPKQNRCEFKRPPLEMLNSQTNEKQNYHSDMINSAIDAPKLVSTNDVKMNVEYEQKLEEPNEENNEIYIDNLNEIPDQDIRMHVFS